MKNVAQLFLVDPPFSFGAMFFANVVNYRSLFKHFVIDALMAKEPVLKKIQ